MLTAPARKSGHGIGAGMDRIIVIGAGQAGVQAVASLRAEGFTGAITMPGDEPFPPYQRPPLSKAYLAGDFARERLFLKPEAFFTEARCELKLGARAATIDRAAKIVRLCRGEVLRYDRLLIATGSRVRRLSLPGADLAGIHYLRGIEDVDTLRSDLRSGARFVVAGGGYIGLEVAAVARKLGLDVTVIETADRVMARAVSPHLSAFYEAEHRRHGVKFLLGATVQSFEGGKRIEAVKTSAGMVPADVVLVGVGIVPNVELAQAAGLACDNGIVVDETAKTSDPDIYAAGDCTNHPGFAGTRVRLESVQNAIDQAKHAVLGLLGRPARYNEVPWFWSDQYDLKMQIAGLLKSDDQAVLRGDLASRKFAVFHLREGVVAAVEAVNAAPEYIIGRKLVGMRARIPLARLADMSVPVKSFA
jgi:3-phenylpropionate/trans-cinnamate dioxygenase ferredoxin reductase subunit